MIRIKQQTAKDAMDAKEPQSLATFASLAVLFCRGLSERYKNRIGAHDHYSLAANEH